MIRMGRSIVVVVAAAAAVGAVEVVPGSAEPAARSATEARTALAMPQQLEARLLRTYDAFDANQGVAVDRSHLLRGRQHLDHEAQPKRPARPCCSSRAPTAGP